jgi:hypothetical protein
MMNRQRNEGESGPVTLGQALPDRLVVPEE